MPGLAEAAKVDKNHSERNAHRLFNKYGLALRVPIDYFDVPQSSSGESVTVPYLSISKYMQHLLDNYEQVMFGGLTANSSEELLGTFWSRFRGYHPKHVVYSDAHMSEADRVRTIPVCIHGDKGRTLQKSPIYVLSFEFPFGLPPSMLKKCSYDAKRNTRHVEGNLAQTCRSRAKKRTFEEVDFSNCTRNDPARFLDASKPKSHQRHNNRGHSFLSRFLVCAIPSKTYKKNPELIPKLLKEVAKELRVLFESGLKQGKTGARFRFALVGAKGDSEWHFEAGNFTRSYHRIGPVNPAMICHLCDAGAQGLPYTDVSSAPQWLSTLGASLPWESTPPLNEAPFSVSSPAFLYKLDPFHVLKFGIFRDACASTVIRLCFLEYFDCEGELQNVPERLSRAFSFYKLWCLAEKKNPSLKGFTRMNMHYDNNHSFAWFNCKGSEVTLLMQWLDFQLLHFLENVKQESHRPELRAMHQMIRGGLNYIGIMHSHALWLPHCCARVKLEAGLTFTRGYAYMANRFISLGISGYRLRPKLHYMMHLLLELKEQVDAGLPYALNTGMWLCESNEDFIGRISRLSRRVHASTTAVRCLQRYLVKVRLLLGRLLH